MDMPSTMSRVDNGVPASPGALAEDRVECRCLALRRPNRRGAAMASSRSAGSGVTVVAAEALPRLNDTSSANRHPALLAHRAARATAPGLPVYRITRTCW